ncbi:MerR family transcriptional regulator [Risungbinella massiliensis]|uniref:MerR family transcriptional regulator n=1 Tax=Risungbinella massiliensis TaxID=1329796 RepID=UPI0005CC4912|nr:MerR family transcriptional regulator [Risungbinella massiliensis]
MNQTMFITTREAAERLQVHARTVRKWIDVFEDYICPDLNDRGHYILSEDSMDRLNDIKARLQEQNKSMKQLREELFHEGKIQSDHSYYTPSENRTTTAASTTEQDRNLTDVMTTMNQIGDMMEVLYERMERIEDHMFGIYDSFEEMDQKIANISYDSVSGDQIHQMFDEIRQKQDQLKVELRNVHFTQKLTAAAGEQGLQPRRQKKKKYLFFF